MGLQRRPLKRFTYILPKIWDMSVLNTEEHTLKGYMTHQFSSVQLLSHVRLFVTPWTTARQASLSITNSQSLSKLISIELVMPSNHLILCRSLLLLPSIFPSIRVFSNESALPIRGPKYWSFSFDISPSNECSGLISFRMDWLDLLAIQGMLESSSTPQFKSINSLALSSLYSPTLTSIHDYWKNQPIAGILLRDNLKLPIIVKHKELTIGVRPCTFVRGG